MPICLNFEVFFMKTLHFLVPFEVGEGVKFMPRFITHHQAKDPPQKHPPRPNGAQNEK